MPEDVAKTLHDGDALTLFLPVDETWQKLHPIERLYLESDFSTQDVTNVVNMHTISAKGVKWTDKLTPDSKCTRCIPFSLFTMFTCHRLDGIRERSRGQARRRQRAERRRCASRHARHLRCERCHTPCRVTFGARGRAAAHA